MAFFGKNEKELKEWQAQLNAREKELNEHKRRLDQKDADITNRDKLVRSMQSDLTKKDADLGKREQDIFHRELEAKNKFVKQQREAFHEAIYSRMKQLDSRNNELDSLEQQIEERLKSVIEKEGEIADRDRVVKERELSAEAGFASKNQASLRELVKREEACMSLEEQLKDRETANLSKFQALEKHAEELRIREENITKAEISRDEGFSQERKALDQELSDKRSSFEKQIDELRRNRFDELENTIGKERFQRLDALEKELTERQSQCNRELKEKQDSFVKTMKSEEDRLKSINDDLTMLKAELDSQSDDIEYEKARLKSRENKLIERESNIDGEVELKIAERRKSFESDEARLKKEFERLRESIRISEETFGIFDELKRKLGNEDPEQVLLRLNAQEEELKKLRSDLLERPTEGMRMNYDAMTSEIQQLKELCTRLQEDKNSLQQKLVDQNQYDLKISELDSENKSLRNRNESLDREYNFVQSELKRFQASYEREEDREARIRDIETPYFTKELSRSSDPVNEIDWLNRIDTACIDYGLRFHKRILYAFHTALKTTEWSSLTVLAGVSGTGKSELPRLYSHFGGIKFLSLSVQPNWDSQESMLGFFNSIDNKFDAQPILRLLAQSQKKMSDDYPGLRDVMTMILLDEMNLAHVELYFAEFLSKLELRRGMKDSIPNLEVKLGAGTQPFCIPLGRNVLWTGTMNQDETTKSLSDKVLDRGIVIHFPRPTTLERRKILKPLNDKEAGTLAAPLLSRKLWESWWSRESKFTLEQIKPFKEFIEDMNKSLVNAGRALGHRVWQSVEYYMANYPAVILAQKNNDDSALAKSMKIAFEDQLVQKVMPKLRGIETRGRGKSECLDKIRNQLVNDDYAIVEDFDLACEFGYGQFIWNSANYLKENGLETTVDKPDLQKDNTIIEHLLELGIDSDYAEKLYQAEFTSIEEIKTAETSELEDAGIAKFDISMIRKKVNVDNA